MISSNKLQLAQKYFKNADPMALIYFVTKTCNCACAHCFYWESLNKPRPQELKLDEIKKVAASIGPLLYLRLSGGEPFVRTDLFEVVEAFVKQCQPSYVGIPSNGFFVDRMVDFAKKAGTLKTRVEIGISIDDLGEHHDQIRKCPGLFEKAMKAFEALKEVKKVSKNFGIGFIVTAMKSNQDRLQTLFEGLSSCGPDSIACNMIRDDTKVAEEKNVDLALTHQFAQKCDQYNEAMVQTKKTIFDKMRHVKTLEAHKIRAKTVSTNQFQIPCVAGNKMVVMYSEGEVAPCETLGYEIGNIRNYDYDMKKILQSERAVQIRKKIIDEKCFCTHECFTSASLTFSKKQLFKIMIKSLFT